MKEILAIISTIKPNHENHNKFITDCVNNLNKYYDLDILIISSDDEEYDILQNIKKTDNITVKFPRNKNYEIGAWKIGYETLPNYKIYFCIQDTLVATNTFDCKNITDYSVGLIHRTSYWDSHLQQKCALDLTRQSKYFSLVDEVIVKEKTLSNVYNELNLNVCTKPRYKINLCQHCSFIISNKAFKELLDGFGKLPTTKTHSCAFERILGIIFYENINGNAETELLSTFKKKEININYDLFPTPLKPPKYDIHHLNAFFKKTHGGRQ